MKKQFSEVEIEFYAVDDEITLQASTQGLYNTDRGFELWENDPE